MRVEILYFEGCPNHKPAVERVLAVLAKDKFSAELSEIEVPDGETASGMGFLGSPTVRVDGLDIEPASRTVQNTGLACRHYPGGVPSEEMIRAALCEAKRRPR